MTVTSIFTAVKLIEAALSEQRFYSNTHSDVESAISLDSTSQNIVVNANPLLGSSKNSSPVLEQSLLTSTKTRSSNDSLFVSAATAVLASKPSTASSYSSIQLQNQLPTFIKKLTLEKSICCSAIVSNHNIQTETISSLSHKNRSAYFNLSSLYYKSDAASLLPHRQFVQQMYLEKETKRKTELANKLMYFDYNPHKVLKLNKSDCLRKAVILDAAVQSHKSASRRNSLVVEDHDNQPQAIVNDSSIESTDVHNDCNILMLTYENSRSMKYNRYIRAVKYEYAS